MVSAVHGTDLRQGDVALIYEGYEIVREIVYKAERPLARLAAVKVAGIVLDPRAVAHFLNHLKVVLNPLLKALGLQAFAYALEVFHLLNKVVLDLEDGPVSLLARGDKVLGGVDGDLGQMLVCCARNRVNQGNIFYFVAEELNAYGLVRSAQEYIYYISAHAKGAALEVGLSTAVQTLDQKIQQAGQAALLSFTHHHRLGVEVFRIAYAVQARHAGNDNYIPAAGHQCRCRTKAQFVYLLIDAKVLFYIGIGTWNVCLRLIIIIIGDKVLYGIVREKGLEFSVKLGGQGLVMAKDQGGTLQFFNHIGHGEGLAGTRNAKKGYCVGALFKGFAKAFDGCGLVSGRGVWGLKFKLHFPVVILYLQMYKK